MTDEEIEQARDEYEAEEYTRKCEIEHQMAEDEDIQKDEDERLKMEFGEDYEIEY